MRKKTGWLSFVKRLFNPDRKSTVEQKPKKWGWIFGRIKFKHHPEIAAPQKTLSEATEEQRKRVLAVAIATAAAAEAAVAAANAAAEVVKLTNLPHEIGRRRRNLAAIKIQSAFRRHLAMKALSALKGLVKLQAVVRGENVRRKMDPKLKLISSLAKTEPRMYQIRLPLMDKDLINGEWRQTLGSKKDMSSEELKLLGSQKMSWDFSLVSKEEMEALWFRKQEAIIKRECMKKFSYSQRENRSDQALLESMKKENGRQSCQFNQWNEFEVLASGDKESSQSVVHPNVFAGNTDKMKQLKRISNACKRDSTEPLDLPFSMPRKSFCHIKQKSIGEDFSLPNSPIFPTYMAATESAKAKVRSMSTPKQRLVLSESCSGQHSPNKVRIYTWSSFNGETNKGNRKSSTSQPIHTTNSRGAHWD